MSEIKVTAWSAIEAERVSFKLDTPAQCHLCGRAPKWTLVVHVATPPSGIDTRATVAARARLACGHHLQMITGELLKPRMRAIGPLCVTPYCEQEES